MRSAEIRELGESKGQAPGAPDSILAEPRLGVPNTVTRICASSFPIWEMGPSKAGLSAKPLT